MDDPVGVPSRGRERIGVEDVRLDDLRVPGGMAVPEPPGRQIVVRDRLVARRGQAPGQVHPDETAAAGHEDRATTGR